MVRVGGGWDTLEHYIEKHDPCRLHVGGEFDFLFHRVPRPALFDFDKVKQL